MSTMPNRSFCRRRPVVASAQALLWLGLSLPACAQTPQPSFAGGAMQAAQPNAAMGQNGMQTAPNQNLSPDAAAAQLRFFQQLQQMHAAHMQGTQQGSTPASLNAAPPAATAPMAKPSPGMPAAAPSAVVTSGASSAPSMLDQPPAAPSVQLQGDSLTVTASNASLTETLRQVAKRTGMQIEGASHDQRIFGTYGPGTPTEVLSALLDDSGYNVMMVGTGADGAPRRLVLSPRSAAPAAGSSQANVASTRSDDDDDDGESPGQPPFFARPDAVQAAPPQQPAANSQPKTPQQMLEELQKLRQSQNGGQTPEPPARDESGQPITPQ